MICHGVTRLEPLKPKGGRPRVPDRAALTGILFVLKTGIPWEMLPQEMGCGGCGMTCWRRLEEWHEAGVRERLRKTPLDRLGKADEIDWERASLDSAAVGVLQGCSFASPPSSFASSFPQSSFPKRPSSTGPHYQEAPSRSSASLQDERVRTKSSCRRLTGP